MSIEITPKVKREIYDYIKKQPKYLGKYSGYSYDNLNIVDFLKLIWDLPAMPSEDSRFKNAEADAFQHLINNADWDEDETFLRRFNLLAGEQEYFIKFIEAVVSPTVREDEDEIFAYVRGINKILRPISCELAQAEFIDGIPCYRLIKGLDHASILIDVMPNNISIYVDEDCKTFPAFKLKEKPWDDYGCKTRYFLEYYHTPSECNYIGTVKIMNRDNDVTYGTIESGITNLQQNFCSLGQDLAYYRKIKDVLGPEYRNFLLAFRDAACFSQICDDFYETSTFRASLIRESSADKALQMARYVLAGYSESEKFDFIFKAEIPYYKQDLLSIRFNFERIDHPRNLNRIVALIGNNGVGKTTVLSQLAECLVKNEIKRFSPHPPLFTKVIATSYSIFDKFFNIESSSFNYVYCGIQHKEGRIMTEQEILERTLRSLKQIEKLGREKALCKSLELLFDKGMVDLLIDDSWKICYDAFSYLYPKLSSGQSMLMNMIIEIVANIRINSLLLLDEPEIHLHPKGITQIIEIVNYICNQYKSCCIMATHSSLIIQELLSRNVIIIDTEEDGSPIVRDMRIESFGENLTTITEDVFGRNSMTNSYIQTVKDIVKNSNDFDDVLQKIQYKDVPISMGLFMLIDKYLNSHD